MGGTLNTDKGGENAQRNDVLKDKAIEFNWAHRAREIGVQGDQRYFYCYGSFLAICNYLWVTFKDEGRSA